MKKRIRKIIAFIITIAIVISFAATPAIASAFDGLILFRDDEGLIGIQRSEGPCEECGMCLDCDDVDPDFEWGNYGIRLQGNGLDRPVPSNADNQFEAGTYIITAWVRGNADSFSIVSDMWRTDTSTAERMNLIAPMPVSSNEWLKIVRSVDLPEGWHSIELIGATSGGDSLFIGEVSLTLGSINMLMEGSNNGNFEMGEAGVGSWISPWQSENNAGVIDPPGNWAVFPGSAWSLYEFDPPFDPGLYSLMWYNRTATWGAGSVYAHQGGRNFTAGATYTVSAWVNGVANEFFIQAGWGANDSGVPFHMLTGAFDTEGEWVQLTQTFTTTAELSSVGLSVLGTTGAGNRLLIAEISITRAGSDTNIITNPRFDNGSTGWFESWTGGDWALPEYGTDIFLYTHALPAADPEAIVVSPQLARLALGSTLQATASVLPAGANDPGSTWASANEAVATVDATTGLITAVDVGTAVITATSNFDPSFTDSMTVTVFDPAQLPTTVFQDPWVFSSTFSPGTSTITSEPRGIGSVTLQWGWGHFELPLTGYDPTDPANRVLYFSYRPGIVGGSSTEFAGGHIYLTNSANQNATQIFFDTPLGGYRAFIYEANTEYWSALTSPLNADGYRLVRIDFTDIDPALITQYDVLRFQFGGSMTGATVHFGGFSFGDPYFWVGPMPEAGQMPVPPDPDWGPPVPGAPIIFSPWNVSGTTMSHQSADGGFGNVVGTWFNLSIPMNGFDLSLPGNDTLYMKYRSEFVDSIAMTVGNDIANGRFTNVWSAGFVTMPDGNNMIPAGGRVSHVSGPCEEGFRIIAIDLDGLEPRHWYNMRFMVGGSVAGRTFELRGLKFGDYNFDSPSRVPGALATGVMLYPSAHNFTFMEIGNTFSFTPTVLPYFASNQNVIWSTDNRAVATVDENGVVTAVGVGSAFISATTVDGYFFANSKITVEGIQVTGRSIYVAPWGDDANPGTYSEPFQTIQHGVDRAVHGDTVYVREGIYFEKVVISDRRPANSNVTSFLTVRNFPGEEPVIDGFMLEPDFINGEIITSDFVPMALVYISDSDFIRFQGFTIQNNAPVKYGWSVPGGIQAHVWPNGGGMRHLQILDNRVFGTDGETFSFERGSATGFNGAGIQIIGYTGPTQEGAEARERDAMRDLVVSGNEIAFVRNGQSETLTVNGNINGFEVSNNFIHNNNNIGICIIGYEDWVAMISNDSYGPNGGRHPRGYLQFEQTNRARNGRVFGNVVLNNDGHANISYNNGGGATGIYVDGARDIEIFNNFISGSDVGISVGCENIWGRRSMRHSHPDRYHPDPNISGPIWYFTSNSERIYIHNNISANNHQAAVMVGSVGVQQATEEEAGGGSRDTIIRNNIFLQRHLMTNAGNPAVSFHNQTTGRRNGNIAIIDNIIVAAETGMTVFNSRTFNSGNALFNNNPSFIPGIYYTIAGNVSHSATAGYQNADHVAILNNNFTHLHGYGNVPRLNLVAPGTGTAIDVFGDFAAANPAFAGVGVDMPAFRATMGEDLFAKAVADYLAFVSFIPTARAVHQHLNSNAVSGSTANPLTTADFGRNIARYFEAQARNAPGATNLDIIVQMKGTNTNWATTGPGPFWAGSYFGTVGIGRGLDGYLNFQRIAAHTAAIGGDYTVTNGRIFAAVPYRVDAEGRTFFMVRQVSGVAFRLTAADGADDLSRRFVCGEYGDNSNPGTYALPWATIQHGINQLHHGDTLYIRGGTYNETIVIPVLASGSRLNPTIITNFGDEEVIVYGVQGDAAVISLMDVDNITIRGLILRGASTEASVAIRGGSTGMQGDMNVTANNRAAIRQWIPNWWIRNDATRANTTGAGMMGNITIDIITSMSEEPVLIIDSNPNAPVRNVVINVEPDSDAPKPETFALVAFNNGNCTDVPALAGSIRIWPYLGEAGAPIPNDAVITAEDQDGNDVRDLIVGAPLFWAPEGEPDYYTRFDVVKEGAAWEYITLTVTAFGQTVELVLINNLFVGVQTVEFNGTNPTLLAELLKTGDVILTTPGNLGIFAQHGTFTIPAGRTLYIQTTLNVQRDAKLNIEGDLVILPGGRLSNQLNGSTILVADGGTLTVNGTVENAAGSFFLNEGNVIVGSDGRLNIRASATFCLECDGDVYVYDGGVVFIHANAISTCPAPEPETADE